VTTSKMRISLMNLHSVLRYLAAFVCSAIKKLHYKLCKRRNLGSCKYTWRWNSNLLLVSVLDEMTQDHTLRPCSNNLPRSILTCRPVSSNCLFPSDYLTKILCAFAISYMSAALIAHCSIFGFITGTRFALVHKTDLESIITIWA
jgi:hypothetical protein